MHARDEQVAVSSCGSVSDILDHIAYDNTGIYSGVPEITKRGTNMVPEDHGG